MVVVDLDIWIIFALSSCHSFFSSFHIIFMSSGVDGGASTPLIPPLRLDVSLVDVFHTHTYAEMSTTRQGKYHAERERASGEKTKSATHTHITHTLRIMYMPLYIPNIIPMSNRPCCSLYASVSPYHPSQLNSTQLNPPTSTPQPHLAPYSVLPPNTPLARPSKAPTISSTIPPATRPTATASAAFANRY